ncbi:hypothetical protein GCM10022206_21210 [Streptomyces chiangmaiensis]
MRCGSCPHWRRRAVAAAYAIFDTPAIHGIPGIKELAQAGGEMAPPLVSGIAVPAVRVVDPCSQGLREPSKVLVLPRVALLGLAAVQGMDEGCKVFSGADVVRRALVRLGTAQRRPRLNDLLTNALSWPRESRKKAMPVRAGACLGTSGWF